MASAGDVTESSQGFYDFFQREVATLQEQIDRLSDPSLSGADRSVATDACLGGIAKLSSEVNDAAAYLPAYDQRACSQSIKALQTRLQQARATSAPKQKFSFKKAPKAAQAAAAASTSETLKNPPAASTSVASATPKPARNAPEPSNAISFSSLSNAHIVLPASCSTSSSLSRPSSSSEEPLTVTLRSITHSIVDLSSPTPTNPPPPPQTFASITLNSITSSLLLLPRVQGPVHLTAARGAVVVVPKCRQFRMHASTDCDVYLACGSRPIIEGCSGVRFAPLPEMFRRRRRPGVSGDAGDDGAAGGRDDGEAVELEGEGDGKESLWDQVDDFGWLVAGRQSPNWRVLEPEERLGEDVWGRVLSELERHMGEAGEGSGVEGVLRLAGVEGS